MFFKKKKWTVGLVSISSALVLTLAACGGSEESSTKDSKGKGTSEEPIELVVNSWFAANADVPNNVEKPWEEYVEEKTNGRVEVTTHYNSALASSREILEGVESGMFDMGLALALYYEDSQLFPLTVGELPFTADGDPEKVAKIIQEFSSEYEEEIWDGLIKVGVGAPPPNYIFATKPIDGIDYMKGKSARVSTELEASLIKSMGGTPTQVAFEELYNSLDKGMIESFFTTTDVYANLQLVEVAPYYMDKPVKNAIGTAVMNEDFFNSLPEDLQTLFKEDLFPKWEQLFAENAIKVMSKNGDIKKMAEEAGGKVTTFSDKELLEFQRFAAPVWDEWVKLADEKGYNGEEMLNRYIEISKKHGVELEFLN